MEQLDPRECYGCGLRIGFLESLFRPTLATIDTALGGKLRAAFCAPACRDDAVANAAVMRKSFRPPSALAGDLVASCGR